MLRAALVAAFLGVARAAAAASLIFVPGVSSDVGPNFSAFWGNASGGPPPVWLSGCNGNFSVTNNIGQSNTFTSWGLGNSSGVAAPVVTGGQTDPLGGTTAASVVIPAVSGASKFSAISETSPSSQILFPSYFAVFAKQISGGNLYISQSASTNFTTSLITNDGAWHLITTLSATSQYTLSPGLQIGINTFDTHQSTGTTGGTVLLWNALVTTAQIVPLLTASNFPSSLQTTTVAVTQTLNLPCPAHVAFRNPAPITPFVSNPFIPASSYGLNVNTSGGTSNPFINAPLFSGGFYWGFANATSAATHSDWMSMSLYKSTDLINWTEVRTNAPYLQTFGSIFANPTITSAGTGYSASASGTLTWAGSNCLSPLVLNVTTSAGGVINGATYASGACTTFPIAGQTTWTPSGIGAGTGAAFSFASVKGSGGTNAPVWWELHAAWLPFGCNEAGTAHAFCIVFGAFSDTGGTNGRLYMAFADTIDGVYTLHGCVSGVCATPTIISVTIAGVTNAQQTMPAVVNVGGATGTNYIYTHNNDQAATYTNAWTTSANSATAGAGTSLSLVNTAIQPALSTDWDVGTTKQDSQVIFNECGFYEYWYTATNQVSGIPPSGKAQIIGYEVSNSPAGPWWKMNAPFISPSSPLYNGTQDIGDASANVLNNMFIFLSNADGGVNPSTANGASMPTGVCP